jgi:YidC/Oxa1 family membrane protein insertase
MKDKILNIVIIFLLTLLLLQYLGKKEVPSTTSTTLAFTTASSYSIPASVNLEIVNNSSGVLMLNPCKDIETSFLWKVLPTQITPCTLISVASWQKNSLSLHQNFQSLTTQGKYTMKIKAQWTEYIVQFDIHNQGSFSKVFTYLFYAPVYNLMIWLIELFSNSLWWAIISITIMIRFLLLWPQHKMLVSQQKLQKIQPKIKALQDKHKWDAQALGLELMKLYSSEKVNPMWSCGFLLIQMPVLLVIYQVISTITDPVNTYYLYEILKSFSVEQMVTQFYGIDLMWKGWIVGIFLGLWVGIIQFIQVKLSLVFNPHQKELKKIEKVADDFQSFMPDPEMLNKFMLYGMPLMVGFFTYSFFAWVGIYWGISTLFGIIQQIFVNKLLKK